MQICANSTWGGIKLNVKAKTKLQSSPGKSRIFKDIWRDRYLFLFLIPGLILLIIYKYIPMAGLVIAFKEFNFSKGIFGGEWVGLHYFRFIFTQHRDFYRILTNTFLISLYKLIFSFPFPILIALLLNELRSEGYKKFVQSSIYLPHFVSWVIFGSIIIQLLSQEGLVNQILKLFGMEPVFFMVESKYFRSIVVATSIWKEAGWNAIIYIAAITGIDKEIYEAAIIDGANRWRRMWNITIPSISSTIVTMLLLNLGRILEVGFEQIYVLYNPTVYDVGDVISTYVYRVGIGNARYSLTTAIGLFQSVVGLILLTISNYACKRLFDQSIW